MNAGYFVGMDGMEATILQLKQSFKSLHTQQNTPNPAILKNCLMKLQL